jgi:hypothetical protein
VALLRGKFSEAQSHIQTLEALLSTLDAKIAQDWRSDVLALKSIIFFANGRLLNCWEAAMESYELSRSNPNRPRHQTSYLQLALWSAVLRDSDRDLKKMSEILDEISDSSPTALRTNNVNNMRAILLAFEGRFSEAQNNLVLPLTPQTLLLYKGFFGPYAVKSAEAHCLVKTCLKIFTVRHLRVIIIRSQLLLLEDFHFFIFLAEIPMALLKRLMMLD